MNAYKHPLIGTSILAVAIAGYIGFAAHLNTLEDLERATEQRIALQQQLDELMDAEPKPVVVAQPIEPARDLELEMAIAMYEQTITEQEAQLLSQQKALDVKDKALATQKSQIASLSKQLTDAKRSSQRYREQYIAQKELASSTQATLNAEYAREKKALEEQAQEQLAKRLSELETEYSSENIKLESQQRVDSLMTDFAALQVDLDVVNTCDKEYLERYGEAKSMLNHMKTVIQKNELSQDYYYFVISSDTKLARKNREICIEN